MTFNQRLEHLKQLSERTANEMTELQTRCSIAAQALGSIATMPIIDGGVSSTVIDLANNALRAMNDMLNQRKRA